MKKLTIILCACAVAVAGLMVSCKNEPTEYVNVTSNSKAILYTVKGTITNTNVTGSKDSPTTYESVTTIDGTASVKTWNSETESSNWSYWYISYYDEDAAFSEVEKDKDGTEVSSTKNWDEMSDDIYLRKIDGSYYIDGNGEYKKVTVSGSIGGKEFKVTIEDSNDDARTYLSQAELDNPTMVEKESDKIELTFTKMN